MLEVIYGENSGSVAAAELQRVLRQMELGGTLYLGYPVLATADEKVFVDALLVTSAHGLIAFDFSSAVPPHPDEEELGVLADRQGQMYASLYNKLNTYKELRKGRSLALEIHVLTVNPNLEEVIVGPDVVACAPGDLPDVIPKFRGIDEALLRPLNAAVQRVSTLRPAKKREGVKKPDSRGAILKRLEKEIANLDQWQNRGAI